MTLDDHTRAIFERDGLVTLPNLFSPDEVDALRFALAEVKAMDIPGAIRQRNGDALRLVYGADKHHPVYAALAAHPRWVLPAQQLLNDEIYIHQ